MTDLTKTDVNQQRGVVMAKAITEEQVKAALEIAHAQGWNTNTAPQCVAALITAVALNYHLTAKGASAP
jgi:hypothetical protein